MTFSRIEQYNYRRTELYIHTKEKCKGKIRIKEVIFFGIFNSRSKNKKDKKNAKYETTRFTRDRS